MHELYPLWIYMLKPGFYTDKPGWCLCDVISRASKVSTAWSIYHNDLSKMRGIRVTFRIKISSIKDSKFHFNHNILECGSFSLVYLIRELDNWLFYLTNQSFEWLVFWIDFIVMNWLCVCIEPLILELNRSTPNLLLCHFGYVYRVRRSHSLLPLSVLCIILLSTIFFWYYYSSIDLDLFLA